MSGAPPDAALVMVLALDKLLRVSRREVEAARQNLEEVKATIQKTIAWARDHEAGEARQIELDAEVQAAVEGLVADIESAIRSGPPDKAFDALSALASRLNVSLPFDGTSRLDPFMDATDPWVPGKQPSRRSGPPRAALPRLGRACKSPVNDAAGTLLRVLTQERESLWRRPLAGAQVSIRRPRRYTHHGLLMGDGTVVDYNGEPTIDGLRDAAVRRANLDAFLDGQSVSELERSVVTRAGRPLATLQPGVACLRASRSEGGKGYDLLFNNCEHFATWALLGLPISGQVDRLADLVKGLGGRTSVGVSGSELILERLGYKLRTDSYPVNGTILIADAILPLPIDLGRAYWAEDRERFVIWMPLWERGEPLLAGEDHPWTLDGLDTGSEWHASVPSIVRDQNWHASLIAFPDGSSYWLTSDGQWREQGADPLPILEQRLAPTARILEELHAGPGRLASKLVRTMARGRDAE